MKQLILSLLFLLPLVVCAQSEVPFKKANTIAIQTGLNPEEAFAKWGKHLAQNGYTIENSNKDFLTISTGPKDTSKWNYDFIIISSIKDTGEVIMKLKWRLKSSIVAGTRESQFYDWEYKGKNDIFHKDALAVVNSFGDYPVLYFTQ